MFSWGRSLPRSVARLVKVARPVTTIAMPQRRITGRFFAPPPAVVSKIPLRPSTTFATLRGRYVHSSRMLLQRATDTMSVTVNGRTLNVPKGVTVLQACERAGVDIPRFCYHDRLSIAGNCRMCLVEVEKAPKPVASCAMPAMPGMKIKTETEMVLKAREGVMEFLLANHPLDCPICDQGGECDLQDESMVFGSDRSRFREIKRTVEDKNLGPFVKSIMTRCIHCTRCVRYASEVCGVGDMGATGRGNSMEIGTYVEKPFDSEISGNVIDLCPVGALTSKPFAFTARPWELRNTESIDVHDAIGCNIRLDTRGHEVMRVLPRLHEDVNEEWISDKSRFAYDGLKRQRLDAPLVKQGNDLVPATWTEAFNAIQQKVKSVKPEEIKAIAGDMADLESMVALKDLLNRLGSENTECRQDNAQLAADIRSGYIFNSGIAAIEDADMVLVVGSNPRMEAPVLNARLRKATLHSELRVGYIGPALHTTFEAEHLGEGGAALADFLAQKSDFAKDFAAAERPMIIVGQAAFRRKDGAAISAAVFSASQQFPNLLKQGWNGINVLHTAAGRVGGLDIGFVPGVGAADVKPKVVFLLNADDYREEDIPKDAFVIYQGHHGDRGASRADVILPGAAYTEKEATYVNTEGRVQRTTPAVARVGDAREDWKIIRALSEFLGARLPYDTVGQLRTRMTAIAPHLERLDVLEHPFFTPPVSASAAKKLDSGAFPRSMNNFFLTDPISRSSRVLAQAVQTNKRSANNYA